MELKETRKMNSWGKLHTLPKKSDNFADFQMQRLLKRRKIQECLEQTEKEMGDGSMSLNELESLLNEEGIDTKIDSLPTRRIAANNTTRFFLINNVKEAIAEAKKNQELLQKKNELEQEKKVEQKLDSVTLTEDEELQKAIQMSLECVDEANTSNATKTDESWTSFLSDSDCSNSYSENDESYEPPDMSSAKAYIMQYSDFTNRAIDNIVNTKKVAIKNKPKVDKIIEDLQSEQSIIVDKINLSSDEDEVINDSSEALEVNTNHVSDHEDMNATQKSVICLGNPSDNVIDLETSIEEEPIEIKDFKTSSNIVMNKNQVEESTDSEFEEVPESDCKQVPVVELTLNMGEAPDDDMFADVFENKEQTNIPKKEKIAYLKNSPSTDFEIKTEPIMKDIPDKNVNKNNSYVNRKNREMLMDVSKNTTVDIKLPLRTENSSASEQPNLVHSIPKVIPLENVTGTENSNDKNKEKTNDNVKNKLYQVPKEIVLTDDLNEMMTEVQNNENDLLQEKGRLDRIGRNISEQMTNEAQELLQIFGIPYIVAPTEAEAQCAFLESIKLTDGTITDDSDIWLFGGRTVYKNFFNQKKHVMQFLSERIEKAFSKFSILF